MKRGRRFTRRSKRSKRKSYKKRRNQKGGAVDLPSGYGHIMTVSDTPASDKIGSPDEIPRISSYSTFMEKVDDAATA